MTSETSRQPRRRFRQNLFPGMLAGVDDDIPVIVRMRVECARCGHAEDETFEFDMPRDNSEPMEEYVPGTCPDCGAPMHMHPKRTQQVQ